MTKRAVVTMTRPEDELVAVNELLRLAAQVMDPYHGRPVPQSRMTAQEIVARAAERVEERRMADQKRTAERRARWRRVAFWLAFSSVPVGIVKTYTSPPVSNVLYGVVLVLFGPAVVIWVTLLVTRPKPGGGQG